MFVVWSDLRERAAHVCFREKNLWENLATIGIVLVFKAKLSGAKFYAQAVLSGLCGLCSGDGFPFGFRIWKALQLPTTKGGYQKPLTLGSRQPGGATWLLHTTENAEVVRRRGRWISKKVMESYLQEVLVAESKH